MNDDSEIEVIMSDGFVSDHIDRNSEEFDRMCCTAASADDCGERGASGDPDWETIKIDVGSEMMSSEEGRREYIDEMVEKQFAMWGVRYPSGGMRRRLRRKYECDIKRGGQIRLVRRPEHF